MPVARIHFEELGGHPFERIVYAYLAYTEDWKLSWLGGSGSDGGRDIWGIMPPSPSETSPNTVCVFCVNRQRLDKRKLEMDFRALDKRSQAKPDYLKVFCGGKVSNTLRDHASELAVKRGIKLIRVMSGAEFEIELYTRARPVYDKFIAGAAPDALAAKEISASLKGMDDKLSGIPFIIGALDSKLTQIQSSLGHNAAHGPGGHERHDGRAKDISAQILQQLMAGLAPILESIKSVPTQLQTPIASLEHPPLVEFATCRVDTTQNLVAALESNLGVWLYGLAGTGKTQLMVLASLTPRTKVCWLRFVTDDRVPPELQFDAGMRAMAQGGDAGSVEALIQQAVSGVADDVLIVLDDVPDLLKSDALFHRLRVLVREVRTRNLRVLAGSWHRIPQNIAAELREVIEVEAPPFTDAEVIELLRAHQAPDHVATSGWVDVLQRTTGGHPAILSAAVHFLKAENWQLGDDQLMSLISGDHVKQSAEEILNRITMTTHQSATRELLYRLMEFSGSFTSEDARRVADVDPVISRPAEHIRDLSGLWIQRDDVDRYHVSPLLSPLSGGQLIYSVQRAVNVAIADGILSKGRMDPWSAAGAISHLVKGGRAASAAGVFLRVLQHVAQAEVLGDGHIVLMLWANAPLPDAVPTGLKAYTRIHQIAARHRFGMDVEYLLSDLRRLIPMLEPREYWVLTPCFGTGREAIGVLDRSLLIWVAGLIVGSFDDWTYPDGTKSDLWEAHDIEEIVWVIGPMLQSADEVIEWISSICDMPPANQLQLVRSEIAETICTRAIDSIWKTEVEKPAAERNWSQVIGVFNRIERIAKGNAGPLIAASAKRAEIIVRSEYMKQLSESRELADQALAANALGPRERFLIAESIGRQFLYAGDFDRAFEYLSVSLEWHPPVPSMNYLLAHIHASRAIGETNARKGLEYAERAARLAKDSGAIDTLGIVQMLGELAIARWLVKDLVGTLETLDEAATRMFDAMDETDSIWRGVLAFLGHVARHVMMVAVVGEPPKEVPQGQEWSPPYRGFFIRDFEPAAAYYDEKMRIGLATTLALISDELACDDSLDRWSLRAYEESRGSSDPKVRSVGGNATISGEILKGRFSSAVDRALDAYRASLEAQQSRETGSARSLDRNRPSAGSDSIPPGAASKWVRQALLSTVPIQAAWLALCRISSPQPACDKSVANTMAFLAGAQSRNQGGDLMAAIRAAFRRSFVETSTVEALLRDYHASEDSIVQFVYSFGLLIHDDLELRDAVKIQLGILPYLSRLVSGSLGAWRRVIQPFVLGYWKQQLENRRFAFTLPNFVAEELTQALDRKGLGVVKATLRSVATSLGVPINREAKEWMG